MEPDRTGRVEARSTNHFPLLFISMTRRSHSIKYPSQYNKSKLVQIFNDEVKTKAKKFTKERIKRENSQASEDGITDGVTGRPLNEGKKVCGFTSAQPSGVM